MNKSLHYSSKSNNTVTKIGRNVASVIKDTSTLQLGIGAIPDQVLRNLSNHKGLGIHTEMLSDGVIPLIEKGIIDNSRKKINIGKTVTGFMAGTRKLYDFVNDNPAIRVMDISYVSDNL